MCLSSSVVSVGILRKQGEVWGDFLGGLGRATPEQHSRGLHSPSSVFGYHLDKDFQCSGKKEQHNFPKWGQCGIPGFSGMLY